MTDIRTIRTKEKIKKAFIALLNETRYEKINVTEIAERANINRVTYYTHYKDKEELVKDIVINFASESSRVAREMLAKNHYDDNPLTNFAIASIISFINNAVDNKDLLAHLSKTENVIIYTYFEKSLSDEFLKIMSIQAPNRLSPKYSFSYDFMLAGLNKIVFGWVLKPKSSKEEFIYEMKRFIKDITANSFLFVHE